MISPVSIGRRIVKVDNSRHALKVHMVDQHIKKLAANELSTVLDLSQFVNRAGKCKDRIIAKRIKMGLGVGIVVGACQWRAGVVVVILGPQVTLIPVIRLEAALAARAVQRWQSTATGKIRIVRI
eukprot:753185-Prymnesium_polylepis.3